MYSLDRNPILVAALLATTTTTLASALTAQQDENTAQSFGKPTVQIQKFHRLLGQWEGAGVSRVSANAPISRWTSKSEVKKALGDHFVREDMVVKFGETSTMAPLAFRGFYAYDTENKRYRTYSLSNDGAVNTSELHWVDDHTFITTSREVIDGVHTLDRWITKIGKNDYTITCKRSIGAGDEFTYIEGKHIRPVSAIHEASARHKGLAIELMAPFVKPSAPMVNIKGMAGVYQIAGSMIPAPGATEMKISGTETIRKIFGGSVLEYKIHGDATEQAPAYDAYQAMAWNKTENCYQMIWLNNIGECGINPCWVDGKKLICTYSGLRYGQPTLLRTVGTLDENGRILSVVTHSLVKGQPPAKVFNATYKNKTPSK